MRNFTIYLTTFLCLFLTKIFAQDIKGEVITQTFEARAKAIAEKIETITKEEKAALKAEVEVVNQQLENAEISAKDADDKKLQLAETRAKNIENRTAQAEQELKDLVQQKVDGKITENDSTKKFLISWKYNKKKNEKEFGESRTTSQFVFALGGNNLVTNKALAHSDFRYFGSHFYEWGVTNNTRILKENNLLHIKYGLSLQYNNLRPTDNRLFEENGKQTDLVEAVIHLKDSRFRNVNLVVPIHLEFDFSGSEMKDEKRIFKTHESFRVGLGGYAGFNVKSKQILEFEDADGNDVTQKTKGSYNVNDFIYGASAYVGYKEISLYVKYDINPLFKDNATDQNNISYGVRFDFN
ncbi:hypothetical protein FNO01nite_01770 [Flavobacterium noncentrifugens]|uniref:Outer membrane protein beta-barrel domain-containing protein n=1 Tax=Flavobacterium noncentrifugens TaxID=1128970 RepID=A0A1G8RN65_9FLAO|nr:hypothetical protein [Flavobacterium noncentrifugens]GEP49505.1 hypothetical protein FNO01nite_01770 [Flavobacterium noncentrifugens]SDJ18333.1 hypothetical protein SAMN04487935_0201 [Flavobacterium noncentrifugens]